MVITQYSLEPRGRNTAASSPIPCKSPAPVPPKSFRIRRTIWFSSINHTDSKSSPARGGGLGADHSKHERRPAAGAHFGKVHG